MCLGTGVVIFMVKPASAHARATTEARRRRSREIVRRGQQSGNPYAAQGSNPSLAD